MWKQVGIEVTGKIDRWNQGTTDLTLRPRVQPPVTGVWLSKGPGDIFSAGRGKGSKLPTIQRSYDFNTAQQVLFEELTQRIWRT